MSVTVSQLAIAPVKGMRLQSAREIQVGRHGVAGDREFLVRSTDGRLMLSSRTPALLRVEPTWDQARNVLTLSFPDGTVVRDTPGPGIPAITRMYDGREVPGWIIPGPLAAALSGYLARPVQLVRRAAGHFGTDDQPVTLVAEASVQALAPELGGTAPDSRRFRMTIALAGTDPWAEHAWPGRELTLGEVVLRVIATVPRCVVTTRNAESGATDARILHALARLRGKHDITFGVWCQTVRPGRIRVGDGALPPPRSPGQSR